MKAARHEGDCVVHAHAGFVAGDNRFDELASAAFAFLA